MRPGQNTRKPNLKVVVRRHKTTGRGQWQCLAPRTRISMAFDVDCRARSVGDKYEVHPKTVSRNSCAIAEAWMMCQTMWLDQLAQLAEIEKPATVCVTLKFDETKELVRLPPMKDQIFSESSEAVETMVSSYRLCMTMEGSDIVHVLDIVMQPVPVHSNKAESLFATLQRHPRHSGVWPRLAKLLQLAKTAVFTTECDGASGNDRLYAHLSNDSRYKTMNVCYECHTCANHQQHLASMSVVGAFGLNLVNDLFAASLFLRDNGHWRRVLHGIRQALGHLCISYDSPPQGCQDYAELFRDFVLRQRQEAGRQTAETGSPCRQTDLETTLEELMCMFNGAWWDHELKHHCKADGSCCAGLTHEARLDCARDKASRALMRSLFRSKPSRFASNKWTKVLPAFDFLSSASPSMAFSRRFAHMP